MNTTPTAPPTTPTRSNPTRVAPAHPAGTAVAATVTALPGDESRGPIEAVVSPDGRLATVVALRPPAPSDPADATSVPHDVELEAGRHGAAVDRHLADQDGSLVAEYGLLAVVAATIAGVLISWASGGAVTSFFDSLLSTARGLVGA